MPIESLLETNSTTIVSLFKKGISMELTLDRQTAFSSSFSNSGTGTYQHNNLINDDLLARALQAVLQVTDASGRMRSRALREKANLTLCETIQVLLYLSSQDILQQAVEGARMVNLPLARDYLSILTSSEETLTEKAPEEKSSFTQAQIAWACRHAAAGKLTRMRISRPSRWTIDLAKALGLFHPDTPDDLLLPLSQAQRLCDLVTSMSKEERAPYMNWAASLFPMTTDDRAV